MARIPSEPELYARWMVREFRKRGGSLHQRTVVARLREVNPDFVSRNRRGGWAINRAVLAAFRRLTEGDVVWSRSQLRWRQRRGHEKARGVR
jgi:hypothetical protein